MLRPKRGGKSPRKFRIRSFAALTAWITGAALLLAPRPVAVAGLADIPLIACLKNWAGLGARRHPTDLRSGELTISRRTTGDELNKIYQRQCIDWEKSGKTTDELQIDANTRVVYDVGGSVKIFRNGSDVRDVWALQTGRTLAKLKSEDFYPPFALDVQKMKKERVLDLGAGTGAFVQDLISRGVDAVGVDAYFLPKQRSLPWFQVADLTRLPFPDKSFTRAYQTLAGLFYDRENAEKILSEAKRVLVKGGDLFIGERIKPEVALAIENVGGFQVISRPGSNYVHLRKVSD